MSEANRNNFRTKVDNLVRRVIAIFATLTAIGLSTGLAFLIYEAIRKTRIDNLADAGARAGRNAISSFLNIDPIAAMFIFPLAGAFVVVLGMLVWRHFDR